jgi:hypothetical protein
VLWRYAAWPVLIGAVLSRSAGVNVYRIKSVGAGKCINYVRHDADVSTTTDLGLSSCFTDTPPARPVPTTVPERANSFRMHLQWTKRCTVKCAAGYQADAGVIDGNGVTLKSASALLSCPFGQTSFKWLVDPCSQCAPGYMRHTDGQCILARPNVQAIKLTFSDKTCTNDTQTAIVNNSQCFNYGKATVDGIETPVSVRVNCEYGSHDSRYEAETFASADCTGYKINDWADNSDAKKCHRLVPGVFDKVKVDCSAVPRTPCVVSEWSAWSTCDASCDSGLQTRTRAVVIQPSGGGDACPVLSETRPCNLGACPRPAVVTAWSAWSTCSASCGGGVMERTRQIISPVCSLAAARIIRSLQCALVQAVGAGVNDTTALVETVPCNKFACPIDCVVDTWGEWSSCSASCGGGVATRQR